MMAAANQLSDELAFIDRMIAECQHHITRLKKTTAEMSREGQDTDLARDVLATFVVALTRHEAQRRLVVSMIERNGPGSASDGPKAAVLAGTARRKTSRRAATSGVAHRRHKR